MTLTSGTRLGSYEVVAPLGAGGMGEVYRAKDTRLGRDVALKVLPQAFARDAERMARFEREAKVLASLNHPNIATIHGLEESGSTRALVMELVEGPTLADRVKSGAIPLDEALPIARQIAEGLEYAHERGIIHRDLKPSNVKMTPDGHVKILDFGLAKALEGDLTEEGSQNSPTLTVAATRAGVLLGTAAYMAPEQARGKRVDRRADIWAFGCVLCELLAGQRAFTGETTSDTLAAIITRDPDWSLLPANTPARVRELLRRCLQKEPRQRVQAIGDARIVVEEVLSGSAAEGAPDIAFVQQRWRRAIPWALATLGLAVGTVGAGLAVWHVRPASVPRAIGRFVLMLPARESLALGNFPAVAISPDGTGLAYVAGHEEKTQLYFRPIDRLEASPLPGTQGAVTPFFSPNSEWIGFFAQGKLKKVSVRGGEPVTLCDAPWNRGASWGPDDTIIFAPTIMSGLMGVPAAGAIPRTVTSLDTAKGESSHRWPEILPGGKAVAFVDAEAKDLDFFTESKIAVERLDTHERKILPIAGFYPRYSPSGHLLFVREGRLFAVPFDLNRLEVTGPPTPVLDGVNTNRISGLANFALSQSGTLIYAPGSASYAETLLAWVDRKNQTQTVAAPARPYFLPHLSPDGKRIAVQITSADNEDIWVYEISHGTLTRLTFDGHSRSPVWSPDGKRIAFMTIRGAGWQILSQAADGSGAAETLLGERGLIQIPSSWSPDGKFLAYAAVGGPFGRYIAILPLEGDRKPQTFVQTKSEDFQPVFSPDGKWIAYESDESGRLEVYVRPFPGPGGKWQVSTEGGEEPLWARNGRELFYVSSSKVMSVSVTTQPNFGASTPRFVADISPARPPGIGNNTYDVSPDGQRFLFVKASEGNASPGEVRVVLNWAEELKRLAPAGKQP